MFFPYFILASKGITKIAIVCLCGYYFSAKGILNKTALKTLSVLSVELFTPCLLYSKLILTLDTQMLLDLWMAPVIYLSYLCLSFSWVFAVSRVLKIYENYRPVLSISTIFCNVTSLPLSILPSILLSSGASFMRKDPLDTPIKMAARAISYTLIFSTMNNLLTWSFGVALLGEREPEVSKEDSSKLVFTALESDVQTPQSSKRRSLDDPTQCRIDLMSLEDAVKSETRSSQTSSQVNHIGGPAKNFLSNIKLNTNIDHSNGKKVVQQCQSNLPTMYLETETLLKPAEGIPIRDNLCTSFNITVIAILHRTQQVLKPFLSTPVIAVILGIISIVFPVIKDLMLDQNSTLNLVYGAIDLCGDACVPLILLALGGQLGLVYSQKQEKEKVSTLVSDSDSESGSSQPSEESSTQNANFVSKTTVRKLKQALETVFESRKDINSKSNTSELNAATEENGIYSGLRGSIVTDNLNHQGFNSKDFESRATKLIQPTNFDQYNIKCAENPTILDSRKEAPVFPDGASSSYIVPVEPEHTQLNGVYKPKDLEPTSDKLNNSGLSSRDENLGIVVVLFGRFAFVPCSAAIMLLAIKTHLPSVAKLLAEDPVFFFSLLLFSAAPPSINLITLVHSVGRYENQTATILMWGYIVGIFVLSAEIGLFMWLTSWIFN